MISTRITHKGAVWLVDAKPPSPFISRLLNVGHSERGNGQQAYLLALPDGAGSSYSWLTG
jgi:hypothetical protein